MAPSKVKEGFRGQALRTSTNKESRVGLSPHVEIPEGMKMYWISPSHLTPNIEPVKVIDIDQIQHEKHLNPAEEISILPHLTLRLNQTNATKGGYKKKTSKAESISDKQSLASNSCL